SVPTNSLTCEHYASQHGFCNEYVEQAFDGSGNPLTDSEFVTGNFCPVPANSKTVGAAGGFQFSISNQSSDLPVFPNMAHHTDTEPKYGECVTHDYYAAVNGVDPLHCLNCANSNHLAINSSLTACTNPDGTPGTTGIKVNAPTFSCTTETGCNPQFNIGQNIAVKATITCNGAANTTAVERLSIIRIQNTF